jgi:integrase
VMTAYIKRLRAMPLPAAQGTTIPLAQKTLDTVTAADLDQLRRDWTLEKEAAQGGRTGPNRALKRLRHFFNWAIEQGYTERTPFKRAHVNTVHFSQEPGRTRRLEGDEEVRLLKHATTPLLKVLIAAGLETGCRIGELLALRWRDVKWDQHALLLPAAITKTNEARDVPLTQNLRALLDMRRHAPDGREHAADRFVFGNEVGEPIKYWRVNQAWQNTCAAANITGLHFHDLRRELASTLRESGAPDHIVADVLGHANISTTSRYLKASRAGLTTYVQQFEAHRAQQKKAAAKQQKAKPGRIRTPFAHGGQEGRSAEGESTVRNGRKSLN